MTITVIIMVAVGLVLVYTAIKGDGAGGHDPRVLVQRIFQRN